MYTKSSDQKVCIITGSSSGLGRASALWFGRANYRLVIHGAVGHEQDLLVNVLTLSRNFPAYPASADPERDRRLLGLDRP
jgi:NAD(P)-dependent dehydrogenase (short-subunit alcohol dehydrogenase family)